MGVVNDTARVSKVVAAQPYMGIGVGWPTPAKSWEQTNFTVCIASADWQWKKCAGCEQQLS